MAFNEATLSKEERISRMEEEGTLTGEQARMLREGLAGKPAAAEKPPGRTNWAKRAAYLALVLVLAGAILSVLDGPDAGDSIQDVSQVMNQPGSTAEMHKSLSSLIGFLLILIVPVALWAWIHNSLVAKEEAVYSAWAQVESSYQRRSDLIPQLVRSISRSLEHESETLSRVTRERRSRADLSRMVDDLLGAQQTSSELLNRHGDKVVEDERALRALSAAQLQVGSRMQGMFALAEEYPELRTSDQFLELQGQLEGTENRINVARLRFNESVEVYNQAIRKLPGNLVAAASSFRRKAYFRADEGADDAPQLDFH